MPIAVAVVALVGGLAAATFVKAFGTAFLAMPRIGRGRARHTSRRARCRLRLVILAGCASHWRSCRRCSPSRMQRVSNVVRGLADGRPIHTNGVYLQLSGIQAGLSPLLLATGLAVMTVAAFAVVRRARSRHTIRDIPAWGCGRTVQTARMEYTATSFAEPLQRVFDDVLHPEIDVDVDHRTESRHYVQAIRYRLHTRDAFEQTVLPTRARCRSTVGRSPPAVCRTAASTATSPTPSSRSSWSWWCPDEPHRCRRGAAAGRADRRRSHRCWWE